MNDSEYFRLSAADAREAARLCEPGPARQRHLEFASQYSELARLLDFSHNVAKSAAIELVQEDAARID